MSSYFVALINIKSAIYGSTLSNFSSKRIEVALVNIPPVYYIFSKFQTKGDDMNRRQILYTFIVAIIAAFLPVAALSAPWYQPDDVNPGNTYQIVFTTSTTITAESNDISIYRNHVNAAADLNPDLGILTFSPILSTEIVSARNQAVIVGPVYNTNGELVANDIDDMWDGTLSASIRYDQNGIIYYDDYTVPQYVWSGTTTDGSIRTGLTVGYDWVSYGKANATNAEWIYTPYPYSGWAAPNTNTDLGLYALSEPITAVPLPPALWLMASGLTGIGLLMRRYQKA